MVGRRWVWINAVSAAAWAAFFVALLLHASDLLIVVLFLLGLPASLFGSPSGFARSAEPRRLAIRGLPGTPGS